jgi:hypothetical protein
VLLVAYHTDVPEYQAVLAEWLVHDTITLARLEYHANHTIPGWHFHTCCGDVSALEAGLTKPNGQKRIPSAHNRHRRSEFALGHESMSDTLALKLASKWFRVPYQEDLLGYPMQ